MLNENHLYFPTDRLTYLFEHKRLIKTKNNKKLVDQLYCIIYFFIQVIKDYQRGWAWTRALLGLQADEIHLCGEAAAIDLVRLAFTYK